MKIKHGAKTKTGYEHETTISVVSKEHVAREGTPGYWLVAMQADGTAGHLRSTEVIAGGADMTEADVKAEIAKRLGLKG